MKIKCDWCGSWIDDFDQICPNCGGVNNNYNRQADGTPRTIEELKNWAQEMNLPLEEMRTYIGEDYRGPKAFGIYQDESDGTFVVYKNKDDGTRAVRYKGTDEAYAVNELYQKMKERVAQQKAHQAAKPSGQQKISDSASVQKTKKLKGSDIFWRTILIILVFAGIVNTFRSCAGGPSTGYYTYGGQNYYYYHGGWYEWNNDSWTSTSQESWMDSDYDDYYDSYSYDNSAEYSDFEDSEYYSADDDWSDDSWDSGWDSDDSWDSGYDDWGSDW